MPTFATITGRITIPGTDIGIRAEVTATPLTTDNVVIDTDRTNWGPATAETKSDGTLTDLKIPLGVAPVGVLWRITVKPLDKRASLQPWTVGIFHITGSTTLQALALNGVEVTAVTETMVTDVTALVAEAEAARDAAVAVGSTNDTIIASRVNDPASATNSALAASYTRRRDHDPRDYGTFGSGSTWQQNRDALQAANDAAHAADGGRVVIPPGTYQCKGVIQDSHVEFHGPLAKLVHPDGDTIDIIRSRVTSTTGTVAGGGTALTVADSSGIEKGAVIGIRAAGGISRLQNAGLGAAITDTQTTDITLGDSTGSPTSGYLVCETEVIGYTGITGNTLTGVTRGAFGTTAASHAVGAQTGVAMRHVTTVAAVSGTTVTLSDPAPLGVTAAPVSTGAVRPRIGYLSFDGNRPTGGASSTVNPVRWDMVRWGGIEWQYVEDAESAFYLAQGTSDCTIEHVTARNCSVPEAGKGAVAWFFQQCHRNRLADINIYEGVWAGVYFDNRTSLATEWDGGCNDNTVDGYNIKTPYLGSAHTNTGILIVGGSRNEIASGHIDGVRTGFVIEAAAQVYNTDAYLPPATGNSITRLKHTNGYQPYVISAGTNTVTGLTYDTAANGTDSTGKTLFVSSARTPGGPPILGAFPDGTQTAPGMAFGSEPNTGFYRIGAGQMQFVSQGALVVRLRSTGILWTDGKNIEIGTGAGTKIGGAATQKMSFWGAATTTQPVNNPDTTGATLAQLETEVNELKALLRTVGLMAAT